MKSLVSLSLAILCMLASTSTFAQRVVRDNWQGMQVVFNPNNLSYGETTINGQSFTTLSLDGYLPSAAVGAPSLPTFSRLIEVPVCKGYKVVVSDAKYDTIQLHGARLLPTQPSRSKSDTTPQRLVIDSKIYSSDTFYGQD